MWDMHDRTITKLWLAVQAPRRLLPGLALVLTLTTAVRPARADEAALRTCRALVDATARLACYDALPLAPATSPARPAAPATGSPAVAPSAAAPAGGPGAATVSGEAGFGLEARGSQVQEVRSRIDGFFEGWEPRTRIRLANGQVWQISDDSSAIYELRNPVVVVRRASMGTFMLDIEGAKRTPRVRRVE